MKKQLQEISFEKLTSQETKENFTRSFLKDSLKRIMKVLNAECGSLFLVNTQTKELILESFFNKNNITVSNVSFKIGQGVVGKIAEYQTPILVENIDRDLRFERNGFKHYNTKSFISIPLTENNGMLGIINIADKADKSAFTQQDLDFACSIVHYLSIIVHQINLAEDFNKKTSLLEKYATMGKINSGLAHEINNPLDGVIRFTNLLLNQINNKSKNKEYLLEIKNGLNRIENITKSLLQFSRKVNSETSPDTFVEVHQVLEDSINVFNARLSNTKIRIKKNFKLNEITIPDYGINQVFINIIKNSLDAMTNNGILEVTTKIKKNNIVISFKDTGKGIPENIKDKIFEPFFTTKSVDQGTGLGLTMCKEIINRYKGNILLESSPKGSVFHIIIPQNKNV